MGSFTYVEMKCSLGEQGPGKLILDPDLRLESLSALRAEELYQCYLETFQAGDAQFFLRQDDDERLRYF